MGTFDDGDASQSTHPGQQPHQRIVTNDANPPNTEDYSHVQNG
jgi:hypothetical protein